MRNISAMCPQCGAPTLLAPGQFAPYVYGTAACGARLSAVHDEGRQVIAESVRISSRGACPIEKEG